MKDFLVRSPRTAIMCMFVLLVLICLIVVVASNPQVLGYLHFAGSCTWVDGIRYCR